MTNHPRQPRNIPPGDIPRPGVTRSRPAATPRRSSTPDDLLAVSWRLEPRDYVLAHLLAQHRFLTTDQITSVLYISPRTCRNRLDVLRSIGFVDWFMPVHPVTGRLPVHWVPGRLSARYVALYHGQPAPSPRAMRETRDAYASAATRIGHLAHTDGVNQFFVDLLTHSRHHPHTRLARWWSAGRTYATVDHNTRPDGHGVWRDGDDEVAFFLEHDTCSMSHPARAAKLVGYRTLQDKGPTWPVLFWLPSATIETHLHRHLAGSGTHGVLVATAARDHAAKHGGPAGPVWKVVGNGRRRLPLAELPGPVGAGGAYHPGPPAPNEDPLYLLRDDVPTD
jgi:Replication-relaxation